MNNLIRKIKTKILRNKNTIIFVAFLILLFSVDNAFAADPTTQSETSKLFEQLIAIGNIVFALGGVLIGMMTQFIGLFLQPAWTTGSIIGLDPYLKSLWVLVSNVIYFVFAFILIVIAFKNIVGHGKEAYEMKTALPHLIVGIMIVPFSWFIIQFILSVSAILTVSSLSLPRDMFGKGNTSFNTIQVPTNCSIDIDKMMGGLTRTGTRAGPDGRIQAQKAMGFECSDKPEDKKGIGDIMSDGKSLFSIMYVYSYGIMRIQDLDKLYVGQLKDTTNIGTVVANVLFNGIFVIRFLILLIALAIAMFSRGVMLWLFTIFSPMFGLLYFFNGKAPKAMEGLSKLSFKDFIALAMVPVYVGLALSFGLMFSFVATQGLATGRTSIGDTENGISGNKITMGGMQLTITGRALGSSKEVADGTKGAGGIAAGVASGRAGFVSQLFIDLIAIAVLWMAVMAALSSSKITESVVAPIAAFGKSIGGTAMKLPQYAPIFPGGQSMEGLQRTRGSAKQFLDTKSQNTGDSFMKRNNLFQSDATAAASNANKVYTDINNNGLNANNYGNYIKALKEFSDTNAIKNSADAQKLLTEVATKSGVNKDLIKFDSTDNIAKLVREINKENIAKGGLEGTTPLRPGFNKNDLDAYLKGKNKDTDSSDSEGTLNFPEVKRSTDTSGKLANNINININGKETNFQLNDNKLATPDIKTISDAFAKDTSLIGNNKNDFKKHLVNDGKMDETDVDKIIAELEKGNGFFK